MFQRWQKIPKDKSLLLLGPRRSGKTTLLKNLFPDVKYVTLDDLDYLTWGKRDPKGLIQSLCPRAIIDEVQRCPELTIPIKYFLDRKELQVFMTGSSSLGLLDSTVETLAGRIEILHLAPACWGEEEGSPTHRFLHDKLSGPQVAEARRKFDQALTFGGFPEVLGIPDPQEKLDLLKNYRDTYFLRDLAQLANLENIEALLAIFHHLIRSLGSTLSIGNFAQESGLSHPAAKKYLNVITQSELAFKLYGAHFGPAKRFMRSAKMYLADNGIVKAIGQPVALGQIVENFVVSELEKRRKLGFLQCDQLMYYRSQSGAEVDVVIEEPEQITVLEIKASENVDRKDTRNLRDYLASDAGKPMRGFLVYLGDEYLRIGDIECIPAYALYRSA